MKNLRISLADAPAKGLEQIPTNKKEVIMNPVEEPKKPVIEIGIEETTDVVKFGISLTNAIVKAKEDGKINLLDLALLVSPLTKLFPAISGIDKVPAEIADINDEELNVLILLAMNELEIDNTSAKEIIKQSLVVIHDIYKLYQIVK